MTRFLSCALSLLVIGYLTSDQTCLAQQSMNPLDTILNQENSDSGLQPVSVSNDFTFVRRIYADLIGRIPTLQELQEFKTDSRPNKRSLLIDRLIESERFADTWTVFYADMMRLRSNTPGGSASIAYVHKAIQEDMPYDELARNFISASGKANSTPEVGYILGDDADPMALAGTTAQIFMGLRVACAECHDHPFDKWTQKDFYHFAAYFGKTRRIESEFTKSVYTTESRETRILWPPTGQGEMSDRKPVEPKFLIELSMKGPTPNYVKRLQEVRAKAESAQVAKVDPNEALNDLLADSDEKVKKATHGDDGNSLGIVDEAKKDARSLDIAGSRYRQSLNRAELASLVTHPQNRYFSRALVNRVWAHLVGKGMVEPVDDFSDENLPSHPNTLDFLADEFVASGFQLKSLIRLIVNSEAYQREHVIGQDEVKQHALENAFLATSARRMQSETLYDSIVTAGHIFDVKHEQGANMKVVWRESRILKKPTADSQELVSISGNNTGQANMKMTGMAAKPPGPQSGAQTYNLENAIELNFDSLLKQQEEEKVAIDAMRVMSKEEIEAMKMAKDPKNNVNSQYINRFVKAEIDDNPKFSSSFRMASPANPEHFLRVFGQTDRSQLGEFRDETPNMRQALMMLNGRLTNEASRVGTLEPIYPLLVGPKANISQAIRLAYLEILTREPTTEEIAEAKSMITADDPTEGMADLRWLLLNCNEFRYIP